MKFLECLHDKQNFAVKVIEYEEIWSTFGGGWRLLINHKPTGRLQFGTMN